MGAAGGSGSTMGRYKPESTSKANRKKSREHCRWVFDQLFDAPVPEFKHESLTPDDILDAWVAWKLAADWLATPAESQLVGTPKEGAYLLPAVGLDRLEQHVRDARNALT